MPKIGALPFPMGTMATSFAQTLLFEGRLCVGDEPILALSDDADAVLTAAAQRQVLALPSPRLQLSLPTLRAAVQVVYRAAWRFFHPEPAPAENDPGLRMPAPPRSPGEHLAADLALRFLPGIYHRVLSRDPEDDLARVIKLLLRQWPLSGVLADIAEPPETAIDFGGHVGLGFLYGERLAAHERPAWIPTGPVRACVEVVYDALGRRLLDAVTSGNENVPGGQR
jgi:hypothetical protein